MGWARRGNLSAPGMCWCASGVTDNDVTRPCGCIVNQQRCVAHGRPCGVLVKTACEQHKKGGMP